MADLPSEWLSRRRVAGAVAAAAGGLGIASSGLLERTRLVVSSEPPPKRRDARLLDGSVDGPFPGDDYCVLGRPIANSIDVGAGEQVRVAVDDPAGDVQFREKLLTVESVDGDVGPEVVTNRSVLDEIGAEDGADGSVLGRGPHWDLETRSGAQEAGEYAEQLINSELAVDADLAVIAPHGGYVEYSSGRQARDAAASHDLVGWACYGFNPGGGAYDRWHVTSTELHPASFPRLDSIADVGFEAVLAFHGTSDDVVRVGGLATAARDRVAERLRSAFDERGVDVPVEVATEGEQAGQHPENVVNWLTEDGESGVQIEQPISIRQDHPTLVADEAVAAMKGT